ncbi:MAG: LEA type 2 family protein [Bacteroidales bacterium]|nr:LEA type 2 family protein [Bacteroidales bacterium]MCF8337847.1 LEA type 2 family protein [Bacteroidales bacterium]
MKRKLFFVFITAILLAGSSCSILNQMEEMKRFSEVRFEIEAVNNLTIAGVDMTGKQSFSDFTFTETARLTSKLAAEELPAQFTVLLKAKNPNNKRASMNRMDWKMFVDKQQVATGMIDEYVEIPPDESETHVPVKVNVDIKNLISGESGKALMNLVSHITGRGAEPSELSMELSPSIKVGNQMLDYPGSITVKNRVGN